MRILASILLVFLCSSAFSQVDTIRWERKSSLPSVVIQGDAPGHFLINSDFFVVGGWGSIGSLGAMWKYNIPTDNWMRLQDLPFGPSASGASFVLNGKGYFLTARDSVSNDDCDTMFWEYNPIGDSWTRRANFPDAPRQNSSYFTYGNKGYVGQTFGCQSVDAHFWKYDPVLDAWSQMSTLSTGILGGSVAATILSPDGYLIGGYRGTHLINDTWHYNILADRWDSIGQMPGSVRDYSVLWGFDSVLIGGGGTDGYTLFNDFYRFDVSRKTWTPVVFQNSFDSAGFGVSFIFNKRGYYFGGYSTINPGITFNNNMWSFDASKYIHDTTTAVAEVRSDVAFTLYPNPVGREQGFSISTSESGDILFYDAVGRLLDERKLLRGINPIRLSTESEVVFYRASLHDGTSVNGKVVLMK